jgi:hypothetical protein
MQEEIQTDEELQLLRNFDLQSEKYCYAQVGPKFVGIGVSNSCNEFFHSLIKDEIPYATKMVKAIQIVLKLVERRHHYAETPVMPRFDFHKTLNMSFLNRYKTAISDKAFGYILKEVSRCQTMRILNLEEEIRMNLDTYSQLWRPS